MTKTLYDPEVEKRGIEKGRQEGREEEREEVIEKLLLSGMDIEKIASILDVDICLVRKISERLN